jgi:hypothetical protein
MMVGNDAQEDMIAKVLGIETYLIDTHLITRPNQPINADHQGSYADFLMFVQNLPSI